MFYCMVALSLPIGTHKIACCQIYLICVRCVRELWPVLVLHDFILIRGAPRTFVRMGTLIGT